ncbi:ABC transporter permease [Paenibacillus sp. GCM10027626]|uniref:ABC transporter permease n=1 Tax=Paenibacillus sp. GCM10027626 TaxID=3273411 RepID=UPI003644C3EC
MSLCTIAYYTALRHLRDVKAMAAFLLLPLVMMLLLGTMQSNKFTPTTIGKIKIGFLNEDSGNIGTSLDRYLSSASMKGLIERVEVHDVEQGNELLKSDKITSFIHVPPEISSELQSGNEGQVGFYSKEEHPYLQPFVEGYILTINQRMTGSHENLEAVDALNASINSVEITTAGEIPTGIDYYAVTTMFQFLLLGALFGAFAVTKDIGNYTYSRLLAAPIPGSRVTLGKLLGSVVTLYGVSIFLFLVSKYVLGANWGGSLLVILLVLFLFATISIALGMLMAYLTKSTMVSSITLLIVSIALTMVSGGIQPVEGAIFDFLGRLAPNSYGQKVLFDNIYEGTIAGTALSGLIVYTLIMILIAMISGRRRVA